MNDQFVPTDDFANVEEIANSDNDKPVLMVNLNKYFEGEYPRPGRLEGIVIDHLQGSDGCGRGP